MIQRIQTLYLLLVAILFGALFFLPLASVHSGETTYELSVWTLKSLTEPAKTVLWAWQLTLSAVAVIAASFFAIFLYKKRKLQKWLCILNMLIILVFCFYTGFYIVKIDGLPELGLKNATTPSIWVILPVIAFIFNLLAVKKIAADEKLIRSLDRIR